MEKLSTHNGDVVKEQWKHGEILEQKGSVSKGTGPLFCRETDEGFCKEEREIMT